MDDPIVFPAMPGRSHMHEFFGARHTQAGSTRASMLRSGSSCNDRLDTAGYWSPQLVVGQLHADTPLRPARAQLTAYYSRGGKPTVLPFPPDLRMVAGKAMATRPQPRSVAFWRCEGRGRFARLQRAPSCRAGEHLTAFVQFPDCWNGLTLDSVDHASHMAYSRQGRCPTSHPRPMPRLVMKLTWKIRPPGNQVLLGSPHMMLMRSHQLHADFWNTWHQYRLNALVWECLNVNYRCVAASS